MIELSSNEAPQPASGWSGCVLEAMIAKGWLGADEGNAALARAAETGSSIIAVLRDEGLVDPKKSLALLGALSGLRVVDLSAEPSDVSARAAMPSEFARRHRAVGVQLHDGQLTVACEEPLSVDQILEIATVTGYAVAGCVLSDARGIERLIAPDPRSGESSTGKTAGAPRAGMVHSGVAAQKTAAADDPSRLNEGASARRRFSEGAGGTEGQSSPPLNLDELLCYAVNRGASDLHLAVDSPPAIRLDGAIRRIDGLPALDNDAVRDLVFSILPQAARERFEASKELDTSHSILGVGRFRVSVFQQRGHVGAVLRMIPNEIPEFSTLGLPLTLATFAELRRGLVLVTGPTGSGKSTTLASIVDIINRSKPLHIMTVEDPIEFEHTSAQAIINQREVGIDTSSFAASLRHVLRQDPDVILVGEMRDLETIATALTAAETGHLVFATLHTQDAPQTLDRVIDAFPTAQQEQVRIQLASALQAVVTQQLLLSASGRGRVPVAEVMVCTPAVRNLIRTGKTHQLYSLMQTGAQIGMQTMDQALAAAVRSGAITREMAFDRCHDTHELTDYLRAEVQR